MALLPFKAELTTVTVPSALIAPPSDGVPSPEETAIFPTSVEFSTRTSPDVLTAAPPDSETAFSTCVDLSTTSGVTSVEPFSVVTSVWLT